MKQIIKIFFVSMFLILSITACEEKKETYTKTLSNGNNLEITWIDPLPFARNVRYKEENDVIIRKEPPQGEQTAAIRVLGKDELPNYGELVAESSNIKAYEVNCKDASNEMHVSHYYFYVLALDGASDDFVVFTMPAGPDELRKVDFGNRITFTVDGVETIPDQNF